MFGVEARVVDIDGLALDFAAQVLLGQRRPFVGALVLGPYQDQAPLEAFGPQGLGGLCAGEAGADDQERLVGGHANRTASVSPATLGCVVVMYGLASPGRDSLPRSLRLRALRAQDRSVAQVG
jgi:hypothetical protein